MATLSETATTTIRVGKLRPIEPRRDLAAVADLVELCFADTLDSEGRRYIQGMRTAASSPGYLFFASAAEEFAGLPVSGFIWEEDGRIVGNLSLIPTRIEGQKAYLIANVAVHPNYRRRGIGRALTQEGIEIARHSGAPSVWLQVREKNDSAIQMYQELGFKERARRTTWYSSSTYTSAELPTEIQIRPPGDAIWKTQHPWLDRAYPPELRWHLPFKTENFRPGFSGWIQRLLKGMSIQQWTAWKQGRLIGVISCQSTLGMSNLLWLAADPEQEDQAADVLLHHVRQVYGGRRSFVFDYPAHLASQQIESAGFYPHQTLIWMEILFQ